MADKGSDECIRYWSENSDSNAYLEEKKEDKKTCLPHDGYFTML